MRWRVVTSGELLIVGVLDGRERVLRHAGTRPARSLAVSDRAVAV
jgi:hypothetical protein